MQGFAEHIKLTHIDASNDEAKREHSVDDKEQQQQTHDDVKLCGWKSREFTWGYHKMLIVSSSCNSLEFDSLPSALKIFFSDSFRPDEITIPKSAIKARITLMPSLNQPM